MDLHYSQTCSLGLAGPGRFESPMDLHYSQTSRDSQTSKERLNPLWIYTTLKLLKAFGVISWFESPMDLHDSQTGSLYPIKLLCLNPLWIYTTLKHGLAL